MRSSTMAQRGWNPGQEVDLNLHGISNQPKIRVVQPFVHHVAVIVNGYLWKYPVERGYSLAAGVLEHTQLGLFLFERAWIVQYFPSRMPRMFVEYHPLTLAAAP